jgi:AraC-like DNA-binding protein
VHSKLKRRLVIGTTSLAAAAFAGGAYAASRDSSTTSRQAFLNDVASRLHVTPQQLTSALQGAFDDQLNAAVRAGKLTQKQADAIRQRMQQRGGLPPFLAPFGLRGPMPRPPGLFKLRVAHAGPLGAAARYLGLTDVQLLRQLASGKSLAKIAQSRGKSSAGLKSAMTQAAKAKLDQALKHGFITKSQEQRELSHLSARLDRLINHGGFEKPRFLRPGGPPGGPRGAFPGGTVVPAPPPVGA